jgi:tagaturonate reductase
VRILNGAHTSSVPAAFLYGLDTVEECIKDKLIYALMRKCIFDEIIPSMDGDTAALTQYADDVLERFANPYIRHLLLSITLNSVSKFKTRVLPSITSYLKKKGSVPPALSFSLAALIAFYNGNDLANGELKGSRDIQRSSPRKGESYPIKDDEDVLKRFAALYAEAGPGPEAAAKIVHTVLGYADWWGEDLTTYPELETAVSRYLAAIRKSGIAAVIGEVTGSAGGAAR